MNTVHLQEKNNTATKMEMNLKFQFSGEGQENLKKTRLILQNVRVVHDEPGAK